MDVIIERYHGDVPPSAAAPANSAFDRILQKSKARIDQKRGRDEGVRPGNKKGQFGKEAEVGSSSALSLKESKATINSFRKADVHVPKKAKVIPAVHLENAYKLEETPEEKKARKAAMKLARNEKRAAAMFTNESDSVEVAAATSNSGKVEEEEGMVPIEQNHVEEMDISPEGIKDIGITQQLFPAGHTTASKQESELSKLKHKGVEIEDVIDDQRVITAELKFLSVADAAAEWKLNESLVSKLEADMNVVQFFPVQTSVIPALLRMNSISCIRPRDVCVAAPTGSGKTLAYAIPIISCLLHRHITRLRALILLPSRELVTQVYKVFSQLTKATSLKVGMATGHMYFPQEQCYLSPEHALQVERQRAAATDGILGNREGSQLADHQVLSDLGSSSFDILVCTPGRLVDHIQFTKGFTLQHLRFLVLDEADRLLGNASDYWIRMLIRSIGTNTKLYDHNGPNASLQPTILGQGGVQLLLFSATFTDNPRKLAMLGIHAPMVIRVGTESSGRDLPDTSKLFTEDGDNAEEEDEEGRLEKMKTPLKKVVEATPKVFNLPLQLKEKICIGDAAQKPLQLATILFDRTFDDATRGKMALIFSSSVETTHRLCRMLQLMNGQTEGSKVFKFGGLVCEMSSMISARERESIMAQAEAGSVKVLVSSDHLARGIDLSNIDLVVNYDPPKFAKTYVHRVGRTARANRDGLSITLLKIGQIGSFNKMRQAIGGGASLSVGRNGGHAFSKYNVNPDQMNLLQELYKVAIKRTHMVLELESDGTMSPGSVIPSRMN